MAETTNYQIGGLNLYVNPLLGQDGQVIRAVNVDSFPYGAKVKRPGYVTYLGTPDNQPVVSLFSWTRNNGTQLYRYRASGSQLYYSVQGTGAWTLAGNGTITVGSQVGYTVLNDTLIISQNNGTTRHTTDGVNFSDTSGAPAGGALEQFQNRVYITGTSSTLTYSVTGDPTNWQLSGTSDSSSLIIPGGGLNNKIFKLNNRLMINKGYKSLFKWDGFNLVDLANNLGPSSPYSFANTEDSGLWINQLGVYISSGDQPTLISNPIQRYFYNDAGSAIAGTSFSTAPACFYKYDYYCAVGSMTDDFTNQTIPNAIIKYNYQKNEFLNYTFNDFPTAFNSDTDATGSQQMIFGNSTGQCFTFGNSALNDNGKPIESIMEMVFNFGVPHLRKDWRVFYGFFNPGCMAQIMIATSDTFIKGEKNWRPIGDAKSGVVEYRFPTNTTSRLLYVKIIENSQNSRFNFYGCAISADPRPVQ